MEQLKVVHFLNHFFAGVGGEEKTDAPVEVRPGAVGPGAPLEAHWEGKARIVATVFCGDNHFQQHAEEVAARVAGDDVSGLNAWNVRWVGPEGYKGIVARQLQEFKKVQRERAKQAETE